MKIAESRFAKVIHPNANIADRKKGTGCDQLIVMDKDNEKKTNAKITFYNSDGSETAACGNGSRCVSYFLMNEKTIDINDTSNLKISNINDCNIHNKWHQDRHTENCIHHSFNGFLSAFNIGEIRKKYTGWKHSPETIEKIRQSALNRKKVGT